MTTAAAIIEDALHLYGVLDQTEAPTTTDIANNVKVLNNMLRADHVDGASQYLMNRVRTTVPPGTLGEIYSFVIGTAKPEYLVQVDAVAVKSIWCNDVSPTVNRETRQAPTVDVVRTTYPGIITKWHQERQIDGSIRITAWQPPTAATACLIEYGGRINALTNPDGSDEIAMPPEGIYDVTLMLGRRIIGTYGRNPQAVGIILQDSEIIDRRWRDWAKGQQWLRLIRS
jgi:hypothetical protein